MARAPEGVTGPAVGKPGRIVPVAERPAAKPVRAPQFFRAPRILATSVQFLKDVRAEMNRVAWPDRKTVIASSLVVVFVLFVTSMYLTAWDYVWAELFKTILKP